MFADPASADYKLDAVLTTSSFGNVTPYTNDDGECAMSSSVDEAVIVDYRLVNKSTSRWQEFTCIISPNGSHSTPYDAKIYSLIVLFVNSVTEKNKNDGVYSDASGIQVILINGYPDTSYARTRMQEIMDEILGTDLSFLGSQVTTDSSYSESGGTYTFLFNYRDGSDGSVLATLMAEMSTTVESTGASSFRRTTVHRGSVNINLSGQYYPIEYGTVTEEFDFKSSSCRYKKDNNATVELVRSVTGTGSSQGNPLIPKQPNWKKQETLEFPVIEEYKTYFCDPPQASSFDYRIVKGRLERFASLTIPKGFGKKVEVLAQAKYNGPFTMLGRFGGGKSVKLTVYEGFENGAAGIKIMNISPKVNLGKAAPYPLGLSFMNLENSGSKLVIKTK